MARKPAAKTANTARTASPTAAVPPPEVIVVASHRVACDGVGGALGHPRVYLEMGEADFVECSYCDRRFVLASGSKAPQAAPGVYVDSGAH